MAWGLIWAAAFVLAVDPSSNPGAVEKSQQPRLYSSPYYGLEQGELRTRFASALNAAYRSPQRVADWYWIYRAFEIDLGMELDSNLYAQTLALDDPFLKQEFRLPVVKDPLGEKFYEVDVRKALARKGEMPHPAFSLLFQRFCAPERSADNEKIFGFLLNDVAPKVKSRSNLAAGLEYLLRLREKDCLSEGQYRKFAAPLAKQLAAALPSIPVVNLAPALYGLMHGGFSALIPEEQILRLARAQRADGAWDAGSMRSDYVVPLYGAFIFAYILHQGGATPTTEEFYAAVTHRPADAVVDEEVERADARR